MVRILPRTPLALNVKAILKDRLGTSLSQINPDVPAVGIDEAVKKLLVTDSPDLLVNNRNFPRLLTDRIDVEILLGEMHIPDKEKFIEDLDKSGGQNV